MNIASGQLDKETHGRIFRDEVLEGSGFDHATTQSRPRAIVLAGQPGSGKGTVAGRARAELGGDVVIVDPDELRKFHPRVASFRASHPYTWADFTHPDASAWASELRSAAVSAKKNVVIDTTLANDGKAIDTVRSLRDAGYDVEIRAVAAHRLESEHGVDSRFSQSLDRNGFGRYVPQSIRDDVYAKLPANLDSVRDATGVPIKIFERDGTLAWDSSVDSGRPGEALQATREGRVSGLDQARSISDGWNRQVAWHRDLPDRLAIGDKISSTTASNILYERGQLGIVEGVAANAREAHENVVVKQRALGGRVLGAASIAAVAYDGYATIEDSSRLSAHGNAVGAQSSVIHFGSRNLSMLAGAELGAATGAALGVESGPGLFVTGAIGGVAGAIGGEKIANKIDDYRTYNQQDHTG